MLKLERLKGKLEQHVDCKEILSTKISGLPQMWNSIIGAGEVGSMRFSEKNQQMEEVLKISLPCHSPPPPLAKIPDPVFVANTDVEPGLGSGADKGALDPGMLASYGPPPPIHGD